MDSIQANVTGRGIGPDGPGDKRKTGRRDDDDEPKALTVNEFMRSYKFSRASTYKLINTGTLQSKKVLGKRLIVAASAAALLDPDPVAPSPAPIAA
jgi:predicted DNA-binding transcriptional regulator AlpA